MGLCPKPARSAGLQSQTAPPLRGAGPVFLMGSSEATDVLRVEHS